MKSSLLLPALLLFGGSLPASAQTIQSHSFSLEVTPTSTGGNVQTSRSTRNSSSSNSRSRTTSQTTTTNSQEAILINVRNFGHLPDAAKVEWYFIAAPATPEPGKPLIDQEYAFDQGSKDINLPASGTDAITAESKEISTTSTRTGRSGRSRRSTAPAKPNTPTGAKPSGWVVRVVAGGKVVAVKGSKQSLEDIARDDAKLKDLVAE